MSDRERWIVYPLLFLALGVSMRDKLTQVTRFDEVICKRLVVVDRDGRPVVLAAADTTVDPSAVEPTAGLFQILQPDGDSYHVIATLARGSAGGFLSLDDPDSNLQVQAGHFPIGLGLRAVDADGQIFGRFPFLYRAQTPDQPYTNPLGEPPAPETPVNQPPESDG